MSKAALTNFLVRSLPPLPIIYWLAHRIWTLGYAVLVTAMIPASWPTGLYDAAMRLSIENKGALARSILLPWYRWDGVSYLQIASSGYGSDAVLTVWPPLYPFLIRAVDSLIHLPILSALIVSSLAALAALVLFHRLAEEIVPAETANRSVFILSIFPTAFFLLAPYSESLFLALACGCFLALRKERPLLAGLLAGLATLTRMQGVFLAAVIFWELIARWTRARPDKATLGIGLVSAGVPILVFAGFNGWIHWGLNYPWPWESLSFYWGQTAGSPLAGLSQNMRSLFSRETMEHGWLVSSWGDFLAVILTLALLVLGFRRLPLSWWGWSAVMFVSATTKIDATSHSLISVSRYILTLFPLFIVLAQLLQTRLRFNLWMIFSLAAQLFLLGFFLIWGWVS